MNRITVTFGVISLSIFATLVVVTECTTAQDQSSKEKAVTIIASEKTVDQAFKNIKVLTGMPQSQLYPAMRFMAASLGFQCGNCHVIKDGRIDASLDDKPEKQTARQMIQMVIEINKLQFQGNPSVSCYTCHRGRRSPQGTPALPLPVPTPRPTTAINTAVASSSPSVDEVLDKYLAAIGGKTAVDRIRSCVVKGVTTIFSGQEVAYEAEESLPDKGHETFSIQNLSGRNCAGDSRCEYERIVNGQQGWLKSGAGVQELVGQQLADQKLSFLLFGIVKLKDQYASFRISGRDKIDDRDVYVVSVVRPDNKSERLYFDIVSGVLRRRISYIRTIIGSIPQQIDFSDYGEVQGLRLPFTIKIAFADPGSLPITRRFTEIKLNVPVEDLKFEKPG